MKKFISIIVIIALIACAMSAVLVSATTNNTTTLKVPVTKDTFLASRDVADGSGKLHADMSERPYMVARYSTNAGKFCSLLMEASMDGLGITSDKIVTKAQLVLTRIYWGTTGLTDADTYLTSSNKLKYVSTYFHPATKGWAETISCQSWIESGNSPVLTEKGFFDYVTYPQEVGGSSMDKLLTDSSATQVVTFDVTSVFNESLGTTLNENSVVSFMGTQENGAFGDGVCYASSEHPVEEYRPYFLLTLADVIPASVVSEAIPANPDDKFKITLSEQIESAKVTVDGTDATGSYTIAGNALELDYDFAPNTQYSVAVDVTCIDGTKLVKTYSFTIGSESQATSTVKINITDDVFLSSKGEVDTGVTNAMCASRWDTGGGLLYKASLGEHIPSGKRISNVMFNFSCVTGNNYKTAVEYYVYNASTQWNKDVVTVTDFVKGRYRPVLKNETYAWAFADISLADVTASLPLTSTAPTDDAPFNALVDITDVFAKAYPSGVVSGDGLFSFYIHVKSGGYPYFTAAMSEHSNEAARPYLTLTLEDIPPSDFDTSDIFIVNSEDTYDVSSFSGINTLESASINQAVKAVCMISNNLLQAKSVIVAIAAYNAYGKLIAVNFKTASAQKGTHIYETDGITLPQDTKTVKAFLWDSSNYTAFVDNDEVDVQ